MANRNIEVKFDTVSKDQSPNVLKFGINTKFRSNDKGELVFLKPEQQLSDAVEQVCKTWGFPDPLIYALQFTEPPGHYVTESSRKELKGKIVLMYYSPAKVSSDIITSLRSSQIVEIEDGLRGLADKASDPALADAFVENKGLPVLVELIQKHKLADRDKGLANALQSLLDIMLHSINATWDEIEPLVISKIAWFVKTPRGTTNDRSSLGPALRVLESAVKSGNAYAHVEKVIALYNLVDHVRNTDPSVQQSALSLINALLSKVETSKRKKVVAAFNSWGMTDTLLQHVIKNLGDTRSAEINHQLYVMQTLFLNILKDKMLTRINPQDSAMLNKIKDLCRIAFESDAGSFTGESSSFDVNLTGKKSNFTMDYKRLGFKDHINPALDFSVVPPGILALDCMYHLACTHTENYSKIVLESTSRTTGDEFPFARASIALVAALCDILKIGEAPGDQQGKFYPFVFQHEKPFEELYCVGAHLIIKTWKEMRATAEDFDKVFDVVREQIRRALDMAPETFDSLKTILNSFTYADFTYLRVQERLSKEEGELHAKPILELKRKLEPEMKELIKQNRITYLISGTRFHKFVPKGLVRVKEKFWFCRLSQNAKVFHYGECEEKATPTPEALNHKLAVVEIVDLFTGRDCPHIKDKKSKNVPLAFSLVMEKGPIRTVDFVAPDEKTFDLWTDGVNALLDKPMTSKEATNDLKVLLHMEIKLRLLDIEGIEIPLEAPPIPDPPQNYDFMFLK